MAHHLAHQYAPWRAAHESHAHGPYGTPSAPVATHESHTLVPYGTPGPSGTPSNPVAPNPYHTLPVADPGSSQGTTSQLWDPTQHAWMMNHWAGSQPQEQPQDRTPVTDLSLHLGGVGYHASWGMTIPDQISQPNDAHVTNSQMHPGSASSQWHPNHDTTPCQWQPDQTAQGQAQPRAAAPSQGQLPMQSQLTPCLLYTSDAADE